MDHSKLIKAIQEGKKLEADELFHKAIVEKAVARIDQFKKDTARVMFNKSPK